MCLGFGLCRQGLEGRRGCGGLVGWSGVGRLSVCGGWCGRVVSMGVGNGGVVGAIYSRTSCGEPCLL